MITRESPSITVEAEKNDSTPDEPWSLVRPHSHHYNKQADFALSRLGHGPGRCLVIGSPLFEAIELSESGWDVTYVDVRTPPDMGLTFIQGDAASVDLGIEEFDSCSSTCVLCHAGLGRYGDERIERGDVKVLANIHRALKKGGKAALTFGPVYRFADTVRRGLTHRIYNLEDAEKISGAFNILERKILDLRINDWVEEINDQSLADTNYLSMLLEKP